MKLTAIMNALIKSSYFLFVISSSATSVAAQTLVFKPGMPEAGKSLTLQYTARPDYNKKELYAYIYVITDQEPVLLDGILSKKGRYYKAKTKLPDNAKAVYLYIYNDNYFDNNFQHGYTSVTRGNESSGNIRLLAEKILNERNWSPNTYFPDLDKQLIKYRELYEKDWGNNEWIAYYDIKGYFDKDFSGQERAELLKKVLDHKPLTQTEAQKLKDRFNIIQERSYNKYLDSITGSSTGSSNTSQIQHKRNISQTYPAYKKLQQFHLYFDTIQNKAVQVSLISELSALVITEYIKENKPDSAFEVLKLVNTPKTNQQFGVPIVSYYASFHKNNAAPLSALNEYIRNIPDRSIERKPLEDIISYRNRISYTEQESLLLDAVKNTALGNEELAKKQFDSLFNNKQLNLKSFSTLYLDILKKQQDYARIETLWKESYYRNENNSTLDALIQQYVAEEKMSFKNYDEEKNKLLAEILVNEAALIANNLSKVKAPDFELVDIEGNKVSLESLRGKKLMIDFWATWCSFCKMSFPELKELQSYFEKNDPSVKFLFIQTMERGKIDKMVDLGKKYLAENELPFYHVVDNHSDLYSSKYYLNSIPAKIFIDSNGNFVYKSIGFKAGYEKNLAEMKAIFNAMN